MWTKLSLSWLITLFFTGTFFLSSGARALDLTFPADCPVAAQQCVEQICAAGGGTLHVEPGTHRLGNMVLNGRPLTNHIFAKCDHFRMIGAGTDETILDSTGSFDPPGKPSLAFGAAAVDPLTVKFDDVEVANMTIKCDANCAATGVGSVRVTNLNFHHLKIIGFPTGILWRNASGGHIHNNEVVGRGPGIGSNGYVLDAGPIFNPPPPAGDPADNLTGGHLVEKNTVRDAAVGFLFQAMLDSTITKNSVFGGKVGMLTIGGENNVFDKNNVVGVDPAFGGTTLSAAGLVFRSNDNGVITKNLVCETVDAPALRFDASGSFELTRWPAAFDNGNGGNLLQKNQFFGYDPDVCGVASETGISSEGFCFDAPFPTFPTGISDEGGNQFVKNESDPAGFCPEE